MSTTILHRIVLPYKVINATLKSYSDLPRLGDISVKGDSVKGETVELVCQVADPGHPEAAQFLWMK